MPKQERQFDSSSARGAIKVPDWRKLPVLNNYQKKPAKLQPWVPGRGVATELPRQYRVEEPKFSKFQQQAKLPGKRPGRGVITKEERRAAKHSQKVERLLLAKYEERRKARREASRKASGGATKDPVKLYFKHILQSNQKPIPVALSPKQRYELYMESSHWRAFRLTIINARGSSCEKCGLTNCRVDVHHITYKRIGCELPEDVLVLCRSCHKLEHGIIFEWSRGTK